MILLLHRTLMMVNGCDLISAIGVLARLTNAGIGKRKILGQLIDLVLIVCGWQHNPLAFDHQATRLTAAKLGLQQVRQMRVVGEYEPLKKILIRECIARYQAVECLTYPIAGHFVFL